MTKFIQLHLLTAYPPSNVNRDDTGRPKTARMGGVERLRISSQSLKRAWRTSDVFNEAANGHYGTRTKRLGRELYETLLKGGVDEKKALMWARDIAGQFGTLNNDKEKFPIPLDIRELAYLSPGERSAAKNLAATLAAEKRPPQESELQLLSREQTAMDVAMFGRMLASSPAFNIEAACQVAHAIGVEGVVIEDDYFTAVDDLNDRTEDAGSSHIGETAFASALFYSYICIDKELLVNNLGGDVELANRAIRGLVEAATKVTPKGKQNSFGSRAYAQYVLSERGAQQPRSLAAAFFKPVQDRDIAMAAVQALEKQVKHFDQVYEACAESRYSLDVNAGKGSLKELLAFVVE